MAREIRGTIYRLTYTANWHSFVECSSEEDLFKYIAREIVGGQIISSVNKVCKDGSTPKVKVHTNKDFKRILKQTMEFDVNKTMTRDEMIEFIKNNPNVKITHTHFSPDEYIYSRSSGRVYTEEGYLFEDWYSNEFRGHNGIRMRKGGNWENGWSLYKEN